MPSVEASELVITRTFQPVGTDDGPLCSAANITSSNLLGISSTQSSGNSRVNHQ